ncbi:mariner Mos1 transposase [Trichonephila clavipes]|nr:mariner Mos1 transposase [Trichonephila clavipes]
MCNFGFVDSVQEFLMSICPSRSQAVVENVTKITEIIEVDRPVNSRSITQELKIELKTALSHLRKVGLKKKLDVWEPHQSTLKNMMDRIPICEALVKRNEIDPFLKRMETGDEKWVTYDNILDSLKLAIDRKRPELAKSKGVVFHQDNAKACTSVEIRKKLWKLGWKVLMHSPYSPDLAPSDYHLSPALQNFMSDKKLGPLEDCENRLLESFANKDQDFYERGIMKLPLEWQQIIQQNGAYLTQIGQSETC